MHPSGDHHEGSGNDRHDDHGKELLANAVGSFAMKFLDLEHHLLSSIMVLHRPAPEVQLDDLLCCKAALVEHVGKKHRDLSTGADQPDHSELDAPRFLPFLRAEPLQVVVGGGKRNIVLLPATTHESLNSGEGGLGRAAEEKVPFVVLSQVGNEIEARVSPIEEQDAPGRHKGQERLRFLPLRSMDADDTPGYGKTPENIIGRGNQTLRVVTSSFILETALRIELVSDLLRCRKVVFGAIEGNDRHGLPDMGGIARIQAVGQIHCFLQDVSEDGPGHFLASLREPAAMHFLGIGPQSATPGRSEEIPGFDVHPLALSAGRKREYESDELGERQLPVTGKILDRLSRSIIDFFGNEVEKSSENRGKLA
jgi:hypothetical protein